MKKKVKRIKIKNKNLLLAFILLVIVSIPIIRKTFANPDPIKSVEIYSENSNFSAHEEASWKVTKTADWISKGTVKLTVDLNTKPMSKSEKNDVILIVNETTSMRGEKLEKLQEALHELADTILDNNQNNKISIISYGATATVKTNLTNNKETINDIIDNMQATSSGKNFYAALLRVEEMLRTYNKEDGRDITAVFLIDGYANEDTPNEYGEYSFIEEQYPYLTINGIQYEMGETILDNIKRISTNQFVGNKNNILNALYEASLNPVKYSSFIIEETVEDEYFQTTSPEEIKTSIGIATLDNNKVIWTIEDGQLESGMNAKLEMKVLLKEAYFNQGRNYPVGKKIQIKSNIENGPTENVVKTSTPIIADSYKVKYDVNEPSGCDTDIDLEDEFHTVLSTVKITDTEPKCDGHIFKGWKVTTSNVTKVNDGYFIMPYSDVVVRAEWANITVKASMEGEVFKVQSLYNIMQEKAKPDNSSSTNVSSSTGVNFGAVSSNTNGKGIYELKSQNAISDGTSENPIYYYRGEVDNNNLLFAGFCWKILRTTPTNGVKVIYNGLPTGDNNNECENITGTSTQIGKRVFNTASDSPAYNGYMFGKAYKYRQNIITTSHNFTKSEKMTDSLALNTTHMYSEDITFGTVSTDKYTLVSPVTGDSLSNASELEGMYTLRNTSDSYSSTTAYYVTNIDEDIMYYIQLANGKLKDDVDKTSYFGDSITDLGDGTYQLEGNVTSKKKSEWLDVYEEEVGRYTCGDDLGDTCAQPRYILSTTQKNYTYVEASEKIVLGKSRDGLTLQDTILVSKDTIVKNVDDYADYKYTCNDTNTTCTDSSLKLIIDINTTGFTYANNKYYGKDVEWNGSAYELQDVEELESYSDLNKISTHHYICNDNGLTTCPSVLYIYYYEGTGKATAISLSNGETLDEAFNTMKTINVDANKDPTTDTSNSAIKTQVDTWYQNNMTEYTKYLEDIVFCNDSSFNTLGNDNSFINNGWIPNGGLTTNLLYYSPYGRNVRINKPDLTCSSKDYSFTVEESSTGNGKLKYPVGLITADEVVLAGGANATNTTYYLYTNQNWWTMSPYNVTKNDLNGFAITNYGNLTNSTIGSSYGIRPVISINPDIKVLQGEGTTTSPYTLILE